jgi:2-iminobutanoate/2-iminopropanoate deaminase
MKKQIINTLNAPDPIGPYSQAVKTGGMLFISGQVAIKPGTSELITDNVQKETEQVMNNLKERALAHSHEGADDA